jgi:hypothetical protein
MSDPKAQANAAADGAPPPKADAIEVHVLVSLFRIVPSKSGNFGHESFCMFFVGVLLSFHCCKHHRVVFLKALDIVFL